MSFNFDPELIFCMHNALEPHLICIINTHNDWTLLQREINHLMTSRFSYISMLMIMMQPRKSMEETFLKLRNRFGLSPKKRIFQGYFFLVEARKQKILTIMNGEEKHGRELDNLHVNELERMDRSNAKCSRLLVFVVQFVKVLVNEWQVIEPVVGEEII